MRVWRPTEKDRFGGEEPVNKGVQDKRQAAIIDASSGSARWQVPDRYWRQLRLLQRVRLRRTIEFQVLPVLQKLESLYLRDQLGARPRIAGKTLSQIENDDVALEAALYLFELALSEDLIDFINTGPLGEELQADLEEDAVGGCGLTLAEVRQLYIRRAARLILNRGGVAAKARRKTFKEMDVDDMSSLHKLRLVVGFDEASMKELDKGLEGRLDRLLESDVEYLRILYSCCPNKFLRALRHSLGWDFPTILDWSPEFAAAVAGSLDHSAKIMALGVSLLGIKDPEVVHALGRWPMKEIKGERKGRRRRKTYTSRIEAVRTALDRHFPALLDAGPRAVQDAGTWTDDDLARLRRFSPCLNSAVLRALAALPFAQKIAILEGLDERLGQNRLKSTLAKPAGIAAVEGIVSDLRDRAVNGEAPTDLKTAIVAGGMFDHRVNDLMGRS